MSMATGRPTPSRCTSSMSTAGRGARCGGRDGSGGIRHRRDRGDHGRGLGSRGPPGRRRRPRR
jgi:hypothetical protein